MRRLRKMLRCDVALLSAVFLLRSIACASCATVAPAASAQSYFPPTEFRDLEVYNEDESKSWGEYLSAFDEPALFDDETLQFAVRIAVSPAAPGGMIVRFTEGADGKMVGISKRFSHGTLSPVTTVFAVSKKDLFRIKRAIASEHFWDVGNHQAVVSSDGHSMLLEVKDHKRYHAVYISSLTEGPVLSIGKIMFSIARARLPEN
jgi:hypothetical protein